MTQPDREGRIPLHYAALEDTLDTVRELIESGQDINARDNHGYTPLHFAAQSGRPDIVEYLIDHGSDINADDEKGMPPLYIAITAKTGDPAAVIRLLRQRGADPQRQSIQGYFGLSSPLDVVRDIGNKPHITAAFADLL